ncbi:PIR protein [Plasmodium yoelii]|uniref:PIR protein n=2 Tax=Plasmodium yoelii TaxID=5861 RepID=A0AAE9WTX1_PLAYO|nr:PIR protein [Plasmodium yoelii]WBY57002.1 PIR protein [Plasmodium yoelii yoelii]CDS44706.1 YIR protein [Plasmodium yoelii]VTZ77870.1 PIR protein [Plasmodium yoelii]|eukprot:XP_022810855.1 PIR protein [Plasmodium yoelii]
MDNRLCGRFDTLRKYLPDELGQTAQFELKQLNNFNNYCSNGGSGKTECSTEADKINAGCLWLFEQNIVNRISTLSKDHSEVFIIYVMIWLGHMLNLKNDDKIKNLNDFYEGHIKINTHYTYCKKKNNNDNYDDCSGSLKNKTGYNNFKEFIEKNEYLMNIGINDMSKFYDAFKPLCNMYTELNANNTADKRYLENAKKFVKKFENLNNDSNNIKDSPYYQVLSTLSNDYKNFKNFCKISSIDCSDIPVLPDIKTKENGMQISEPSSGQISEVTSSSSSITNKLIPILSIIVAIPIFLGIFYKYSLFGFRKRTQKQHLREKIKK